MLHVALLSNPMLPISTPIPASTTEDICLILPNSKADKNLGSGFSTHESATLSYTPFHSSAGRYGGN